MSPIYHMKICVCIAHACSYERNVCTLNAVLSTECLFLTCGKSVALSTPYDVHALPSLKIAGTFHPSGIQMKKSSTNIYLSLVRC